MRLMRSPLTTCAVLAAALGLLAACSRTQTLPAGGQGRRPTVVASVAASTVEAIEQLAEEFRAQSDVSLKINPGPTNSLATQILAGAPADVFLSANREWADNVEEAGHVAARVDLLSNRLVVVAPRGNPAGIKKPEDLAGDSVKKLALAGENVPAGMYADQALAKLGLLESLIDGGRIARGADVRATLGYVEQGEAEAGIVYASDVRAAPGVEQVCELDAALHEEIVYVLVLLKHDSENPAARQFYHFLQLADASQVFTEFGFVPLVGSEKK